MGEGIPTHKEQLKTRLFRPSERISAQSEAAPITVVNDFTENVKAFPGFVTASLRGSHALGYAEEGSDLDIGLLYDSSTAGFDPKSPLKDPESLLPIVTALSEKYGTPVSVTPYDIAWLMQLSSMPQSGDYFTEIAAMLCETLSYDYDAAKAAGPAADYQDPKIAAARNKMRELLHSYGSEFSKVFARNVVNKLMSWERRRTQKINERLSQGGEVFNYADVAQAREALWQKHVYDMYGVSQQTN